MSLKSSLSILAIPRFEGFVDPAVRVFGGLGRCELLLHPLHARTEGSPTASIFLGLGIGRRSLESRLPRIRSIVGRTTLGVESAFRVLAFLACPRWRLCHDRSLLKRLKRLGKTGALTHLAGSLSRFVERLCWDLLVLGNAKTGLQSTRLFDRVFDPVFCHD